MHDEAAVQCFDVRERTIKSGTDNLATLFWNRKGSVTADSATSRLLRVRAIHQHYHRYIPLKDYIPGPVNSMADDASQLFQLSDFKFLTYFNSTYPQPRSWHLWNPTSQMHSAVISALHSKRSRPASFLLAPEPPLPTGYCERSSVTTSPLILPHKSSKTPFLCSKSSPDGTGPEKWLPAKGPSDLALWKMPYAALGKRSQVWGPRTRA
jgi:hypothetical protein